MVFWIAFPGIEAGITEGYDLWIVFPGIEAKITEGYGFMDCIPWYRGRDYRQQAPTGQAPPVIYT
jgi:hypothetical protein